MAWVIVPPSFISIIKEDAIEAEAPAPRFPAPVTVTVPALMTVLPVYVLFPDIVRLPDPSFVKVPPCAMDPLKIRFPAPPTVRPNAPDVPPSTVRVSASQLILDATVIA